VKIEMRGPKDIDIDSEELKPQQRKRLSRHLRNLFLWINVLLGFHSSGFDNLIPVFLHFPYQHTQNSFLRSASGFGKGSAYIGAVLTGCGLTALSATLLLYPRLTRQFGQASCLKMSSTGFPFIYFVIALSVGFTPKWLGEAFLLLCVCLTIVSTVTLKQCCLVLLTNSIDALDLARLNGLNVTVASIARGLGAIVIGAAFSLGAGWGYVVIPFWILALIAGVGAVLVLQSKEST
jgi:MFS family permease